MIAAPTARSARATLIAPSSLGPWKGAPASSDGPMRAWPVFIARRARSRAPGRSSMSRRSLRDGGAAGGPRFALRPPRGAPLRLPRPERGVPGHHESLDRDDEHVQPDADGAGEDDRGPRALVVEERGGEHDVLVHAH